MKNKNHFLIYLLKQFVFWLLFFQVNRIIFLSYNYELWKEAGFKEAVYSFLYGMRLDLSAAAYCLSLPVILMMLDLFLQKPILNRISKMWTIIFILLISILTSAELGLYDEWGVKINFKAISYLSSPSEILSTATTYNIISALFLISIQGFVGIYTYLKFVYQPIQHPKKRLFTSISLLIFGPLLLVLLMRGGLQMIPINQSFVYYSKSDILNSAAVNSSWNLIHSIRQNRKNLNHNPYVVMQDKQANTLVNNLFTPKKDTFNYIFTIEKPNVVLIILESWTADFVYNISGQYKDITPGFNKLCESGLLFNNHFSNGLRSEQGMTSLFCGFPSQPVTNINRQPDKVKKLPSFIKAINPEYFTSLYFGGSLQHGKLKGLFHYVGFNELIDIESDVEIKNEPPKSKLGYPDEDIYNYALGKIESNEQPFFTSIYTLSSHSPYDIPTQKSLGYDGNYKAYIDAVHYSDSCLFDFISKAKTKDWAKETIFIITADHSHLCPRNWHPKKHETKRIPFLIVGEPLKSEFKNTVHDKYSDQNDFPTTFLKQLNVDHSKFTWSKDIFNPYQKGFAYHCFDNGVGWVDPTGFYAYDYNLNLEIEANSKIEADKIKLKNNAQAYLQKLYREYLNY